VVIADGKKLMIKKIASNPLFSPGRRPYPPACKPYGLEAEPEANWGETPKFN